MKNVVFDFGNVLIRWAPETVFAPFFDDPEDMHETLERIGFQAWNLEQDRGRSWDDAVAAGAAAHPDAAHLFVAYKNGLEAAHADTIEGSIRILSTLHEGGIPVYGITNASPESYEIMRTRLAKMNVFRDVVISAHEGVVKPDPEIFHILMKRNSLRAEECVFIDDSPKNVDGAKAVGMDAIHFTGPEDLAAALGERQIL